MPELLFRDGFEIPTGGVLLGGQPQDLALDRLVSLTPIPAGPDDESGTFLLSRLDVTLEPDATVGEVNAALDSVDGGIAGMEPGFDTVVVAVPRQADADALRTLAATLGGEPGILFAFPGRSSPDRFAPPAPANSSEQLRHLQDARFLPAWNARAAAGDCTSNRVVVVVPDTYLQGNGVKYATDFALFDEQVPGVPAAPQFPGTTVENFHGYNVLVTLAARADAHPPAGALPFPECLDLRPLQRKRLTDTGLVQSINQTAQEILAETPGAGNFIVSHAWGFPSCADDSCNPGDATALARELPLALQMAQVGVGYRLLLSRFSERMLTISAAGNERAKPVKDIYPGIGHAAYDSPMNIAARSDATMSWIGNKTLWDPDEALFPCTPVFCAPALTATAPEQAAFEASLQASGRDHDPPAANVLIVGSVDPQANGVNSTSDFSDDGADVEAVGRDIPTLPGGFVQGTSFTSPQVTGLAAYLWLLSPELRSRPVVDTINAIKENVCLIGCAGVIDAYATVLALDSGQPLSANNSRIRMAILDAAVPADSHFTEADLSVFIAALLPGGMAPEPTARDDSRHDLNGDGYTGGSRRAAFDLDPGDSPAFVRPLLQGVSFDVHGKSITYNERRVTDLEILCYYAYSALYDGDASTRDQLLDQHDCAQGPLVVLAGQVTEEWDVEIRIFGPSAPPDQPIWFQHSLLTLNLKVSIDTLGTYRVEEISGTFAASNHCTPSGGTETITATIDESFAGISVQGTAGFVLPVARGSLSTANGGCGNAPQPNYVNTLRLDFDVVLAADGVSVEALDFNRSYTIDPAETGDLETAGAGTITGMLVPVP